MKPNNGESRHLSLKKMPCEGVEGVLTSQSYKKGPKSLSPVRKHPPRDAANVLIRWFRSLRRKKSNNCCVSPSACSDKTLQSNLSRSSTETEIIDSQEVYSSREDIPLNLNMLNLHNQSQKEAELLDKDVEVGPVPIKQSHSVASTDSFLESLRELRAAAIQKAADESSTVDESVSGKSLLSPSISFAVSPRYNMNRDVAALRRMETHSSRRLKQLPSLDGSSSSPTGFKILMPVDSLGGINDNFVDNYDSFSSDDDDDNDDDDNYGGYDGFGNSKLTGSNELPGPSLGLKIAKQVSERMEKNESVVDCITNSDYESLIKGNGLSIENTVEENLIFVNEKCKENTSCSISMTHEAHTTPVSAQRTSFFDLVFACEIRQVFDNVFSNSDPHSVA